MYDPVVIDQQYAALKHVLPLYSGRRIRLLRIVEFIEPLAIPDGWRFLLAYLPDLLPMFTSDLRAADLTGTSPAFLRRIERVVNACTQHVPNAFLPGEADSLCTLTENAVRQAELWSLDPERTEPRVMGAIRVVVPLVEQEHLVRGAPPVFGTLGHLTVTVDRGSDGTRDKLFIGHLGVEEASGSTDHAIPLQGARSLAASYVRRGMLPAIRVACTLDRPELLEGESFGLGIAAAAVCGILRLVGHREEFALRPDVAFTGCIDGAGNVLPVEEAGLRLKIEACLFSPIKVLVVPASQMEFCARFLHERLADIPEYRGGNKAGLVQIGVSRLEEIFQNRLLTASRQVPAYRRVWRRLWRMRRVLAVGLIVIMALLITRLIYGPLDKNPALVEFEGVALVVKNADGQ